MTSIAVAGERDLRPRYSNAESRKWWKNLPLESQGPARPPTELSQNITYHSLPPFLFLSALGHQFSNTVISPLLHPLRTIGQPLDFVQYVLSFVLPPSIISVPRQRGPSLLRQTCFCNPSPDSLSHQPLPHILTQSLRSDIIPGLPVILLRFNPQG